MKLRREHVVGIRTDLPSCEVHVAPSGSIIYPCDDLLVLSDLSPTASAGSQSFVETTKPNSRLVAYSISNDGTLLALAENNNSSENASVSLVTLYSLAATNKSTTKKKKVIQVESGILHISFVDSTHILVLGDGPDYKLTLWSTGTSSSSPASPGTRHPRHPGGCLASIKLATPSGKTIYRAEVSPIKDNAGNSLVCITGDGVLRLFRLSITNSTFRPVTVNLKRKQQNYISQLWLSSGQIALGTDTGEILIIENNATQAVLKLPEPHTVVTSLAESSRGDLVVGSDESALHLYGIFQDTKKALFQRRVSNSVASGVVGRNDASIISLSVSVVDGREVIYAATTDERLLAVSLNSVDEESSCAMKNIKPAIPTFLSSKESTCTNSISICLWQPLVAVSSYDARSQSSCVQVWNYHTKKLEASQSFESDGPIQSICFHPSSFQIVVGTKEKAIVCNLVHSIAHGSEGERNKDGFPSIIKSSEQIDMPSGITICQYSNGGQYLAVCSGAIVTIYDAFTLTVICVLRGHSTDLVAIKFQDGDQHFCTIGGDGVLCVWSIPSGKKILRHVNALSAYECAAIDGSFSRAIVGNANESSVSKIELNLQEKTAQEEVLDFANEVRGKLQLSSCGRLLVGTTSDTEGNESILMTSLMEMEQTGVAPSMRQISSLQLFGQNLFVASSSGSMHHFTIVDVPFDQSPIEEAEVESACHAILSDQVLVSESDLVDRRVLIQSLEQQLAELQQQNADEIERLDNKCRDALEAIQEQSQLDDREHQRRCREAAEQRSKMEQDSKKAVSTLEKSHLAQMKDIEQTMEQKIAFEIERTESMKSECASKMKAFYSQVKGMEHQNAVEIKQVSFDFNTRTENEVQLQEQISKQQEDLLEKHHRLMQSLEATGDDEITGIMLERERELLVDQKATRQLREEQAILKAKLDSLMSDLDEQKDTIESLQEKEAELVASIDGARDYIRQRQSDMHSQNDELSAGKDEEVDLTRKCTELHQRHACLEEEIAQRNELLSQIEADIADKEKTAAQIRADLTASKRAHANVNLAIANLKDKTLGLDRERQRQKSRIDEMAACTVELENDIFSLVSSKKNGHGEIKAKLLPLCTKYLKTVGDSSSRISSMRIGTPSKRGREAKESESQRREQNLRKKIETIKAAMAKAEKKHAQDMARLRWQQKVLKQNLSDMGSSDDVPSDSSPVGKENSANNETSGE